MNEKKFFCLTEQKHVVTVDGLTLKCSCGWKKEVEYRFQVNDEADAHYDAFAPERFTLNRPRKCNGNLRAVV